MFALPCIIFHFGNSWLVGILLEFVTGWVMVSLRLVGLVEYLSISLGFLRVVLG
jgi:hypothetical protein